MDSALAPLAIAFLVLFPFIFGGIWCAACFGMSRIGGWRRLAEKFSSRKGPSGRRFWFQSGRVGKVRYSSCLTIYSSAKGLYLSVWLPFRPGHPPLLIPWEVMRNATSHRFLWMEAVAFEVGTPRITAMELSKKVFDGRTIVS